MSMRRRSKAERRRSLRGPSRARSPSRCSARMAAASSMPMPRTPTRIRRRSQTSFRCGRSSRFGRPSPTPLAAWSATSGRAGRSWRDGLLFIAGVAVCYWAEASGNPILTALGLDPAGGNMEGKEVRFGIATVGALCRRHHGRLLRRRQCHARQFHPARRHDPADQHRARRGYLSAASARASTACSSLR